MQVVIKALQQPSRIEGSRLEDKVRFLEAGRNAAEVTAQEQPERG